MLRFAATRLLRLVVIIFLVSVGTFFVVHLLPGDPTVAILGPNDTPSARAELLKQLGLNKGLLAQYGTWISNVVHGNLGASFLTKQTVANALGEAVPIDLELIVFSQVIAFVIAVPLAMVAALRPNRAFDQSATVTTFGLYGLPAFVIGPLLVLGLAVHGHVFPATGWTRLSQGLGSNLRSAFLPSLVLGLGSIAIYYRLLRADMISTLQEDFVVMARSKGLSTPYLMVRHVLRPSSLTLAAGAGINIGTLFTGAFVVEALFSLPGVAYILVQSIYSDDYLMVQGMALVAAVAFVVIIQLAEVVQLVLDPRIRRA